MNKLELTKMDTPHSKQFFISLFHWISNRIIFSMDLQLVSYNIAKSTGNKRASDVNLKYFATTG